MDRTVWLFAPITGTSLFFRYGRSLYDRDGQASFVDQIPGDPATIYRAFIGPRIDEWGGHRRIGEG